MTNLEQELQQAINELSRHHTQETVPMHPTEVALYKFCRLALREWLAWQENPNVYSDNLKRIHQDTIDYLEFQVGDIENKISVSFILKKEDLYGTQENV